MLAGFVGLAFTPWLFGDRRLLRGLGSFADSKDDELG